MIELNNQCDKFASILDIVGENCVNWVDLRHEQRVVEYTYYLSLIIYMFCYISTIECIKVHFDMICFGEYLLSIQFIWSSLTKFSQMLWCILLRIHQTRSFLNVIVCTVIWNWEFHSKKVWINQNIFYAWDCRGWEHVGINL